MSRIERRRGGVGAGDLLEVRSADLWRIPAWRWAFPAALVSRLGDLVFDLTVVLWISTDVAAGRSWAPAAVSGALVAVIVPVLIVGPIAGVQVDRRDRHRILITSNAVQAVAIGSLLVLAGPADHLPIGVQLAWIYLAMAISGAAGQFFTQARLAMIAATVPDRLRTLSFSVQGSTTSLLGVIGPPLAAPLLFTAGIGWALGLDAASFLVSSVLLSRIVWDSRPDASTAEVAFTEALRDGARCLRESPALQAIGLAVTVATLGTGAINVVEVFFVTDALHRPASLLGVLSAAFALGGIAGTLLAPRLERWGGPNRVFVIGMVLSGLLLMGLSRSTTLTPAVVLMFVTAIPLGALNTVFMPMFMRTVPPALLGRTSVLFNVLPAVASLVAMVGTGWLVSSLLRGLDVELLGLHFGPVDTVYTAGGLLIAVTGLAVARPLAGRGHVTDR